MRASENGKHEVVRFLLELGVEKETKSKVRNLMMIEITMTIYHRDHHDYDNYNKYQHHLLISTISSLLL